MVKFLSIHFFSWISSIFVAFFKSSLFFVSLCIKHEHFLYFVLFKREAKIQSDQTPKSRDIVMSVTHELLTALTPLLSNLCVLRQRNRVQVSTYPFPEL